MTLGPDRKTITRWLAEPFYQSDNGAGNGGGVTTPPAGEDANKPGNTGQNETKPKDDDGAKPKGDDKPKPEALTLEHDGKKYVLQDYVDSVASRARNEGREAGKRETEEAARLKALEEQGDFKALYETEKENREKAEREVAELRLSELKTKIGSKHGLTAKLVSRLVGTTEAELEADAKELAKELGTKPDTTTTTTKTAPKTEAGSGGKVRSTGTENGDDKESRQPVRTFRFQSPGDVSWNKR